MSAPAVGIDLGTTNSVVAVSQAGRAQVLSDASGQTLIPSVVSFPEEGGRLVGRSARARRSLDPANTIYSVKRLLGRAFKSEEVRRAKSRMAFELREGAESAVMVSTRGGELSLPEVSALVLREVRRVAEESLQEKVERCVVTVPANFNELQRSSTKAAGRIAEIEVIRILNEPTAAALAYGYGRGTREKICIFDFGGGTFDVTLLELAGNVFEVLATAGDTFLGGDDIDVALTDSLLTVFQRATKVDALQDKIVYDVLRDAVEQAKCALSTAESARVNFSFNSPQRGALSFQHTLSRDDMEKVSAPFVSRTFDVCSEALKLANLRATDLTAVILVGGSTRILSVRQRVSAFFGRDPLTNLPPEEVVALGASILAEALTGGPRRVNTRPLTATGPVGQPVKAPQGPSSAATISIPPSSPNAPKASSGEPSRAVPKDTLKGIVGTPKASSGAKTSGPAGDVSAPAPRAPPQGVGPTFDLDDPFAERAPVGEILGLKSRDSDAMWRLGALNDSVASPGTSPRTLPEAPVSTAMASLDEPSFMGRLPTKEASDPGIRVPRPETPEERTVQVPAFNLEDPSFVGQMPSKPMVKRRDDAVATLNPDDPFSTVFSTPHAASPSPGFQAPAQSATNEVSIPAFNISPDGLFGGDPLGSGAKTHPVVPPDSPSGATRPRSSVTRAMPPEIPSGITTQKMSAIAPPPAPIQPPPFRPPPMGLPPANLRSANPRGASPQTASSTLVLPPPLGGSLPSIPPTSAGSSPPGFLAAPLLLDVTPFSLGVETAGGLCETVIRRNATIPVEQTRVFATTNDSQDSVLIRIAQGESRRFPDNQALGELELTGLREASRGEVAIAVTFELEADGTLKVRAKDVETGQERAIKVTLLTLPTEAQQGEMAARSRAGAS